MWDKLSTKIPMPLDLIQATCRTNGSQIQRIECLISFSFWDTEGVGRIWWKYANQLADSRAVQELNPGDNS